MAAPITKIPDEIITQFCDITGCQHEQAKNLLEACNGNLDMAVGMHLDSGLQTDMAIPSGSGETSTNSQCTDNDAAGCNKDDDVRAPIPQKQEVLVEETERVYGFHGKRRRGGTASVFDGFRNFQRETSLLQEHGRRRTNVQATSSENGLSNYSSKAMEEKRRTLEDLFRPPIDLMYTGTFDEAKDHGSTERKWLMVNVQNVQEFSCQALNRDVWSNEAVKAIVKEHFVLWQVYYDSQEGQRFSQFYKVDEWPYVSILDPRTGENLVTWHRLDALSFCDLVSEFLSSRPVLEGCTPTPPVVKRRKLSESMIDADEDCQMEAAIKESLRHDKLVAAEQVAKTIQLSDSDSECDLETFSSSDDEKTSKSPVKSSKKLLKPRPPSPPTSSKDSVSSVSSHSRLGELSKSAAYEKLLAQAEKVVSDDSNSGLGSECRDKLEADRSSPECWQRLLGSDEDPVTRLVLRLPDGKRVELKWPCSSPLEALITYMTWLGYSIKQYELVTNYPRRVLTKLPINQSLKDSGLHPQQTAFIQEMDDIS